MIAVIRQTRLMIDLVVPSWYFPSVVDCNVPPTSSFEDICVNVGISAAPLSFLPCDLGGHVWQFYFQNRFIQENNFIIIYF